MKIVKVQIDHLTVGFAELSEVDSHFISEGFKEYNRTKNVGLLNVTTYLILKLSLKYIEGLIADDGSTYSIFLDGNEAADKTILDLLFKNTPTHVKIAEVCYQIMLGSRHKFIDQHGQKLTGVKVLSPSNLSLLN